MLILRIDFGIFNNIVESENVYVGMKSMFCCLMRIGSLVIVDVSFLNFVNINMIIV